MNTLFFRLLDSAKRAPRRPSRIVRAHAATFEVVLNQPQVGILGTGALVKRPVVISDPRLGQVIAIRDMMYLSLSYDHRLVDGAEAARFLSTLKARLEEGDFGAEFGL